MGVRGAGAQAGAPFSFAAIFIEGKRSEMTSILKGTLVSAPAPGRLEVHAPGYLVLEDGVLSGVFDALPSRYDGAPVDDFGNCL